MLAHSAWPEPGAYAGCLGLMLGAVVGHQVADRVPDLGAEFGVGDVAVSADGLRLGAAMDSAPGLATSLVRALDQAAP